MDMENDGPFADELVNIQEVSPFLLCELPGVSARALQRIDNFYYGDIPDNVCAILYRISRGQPVRVSDILR